MRIRFNKVDGIIRIYDRTRYLVLFGPEKYDTIYNRMRYLVSLKSSITCFFHYYAKIKVDSYDPLPMKKTLTLHVVILLKSSLNKDQNHYYYCNIFQEKYLYQLAKKITTTFFLTV